MTSLGHTHSESVSANNCECEKSMKSANRFKWLVRVIGLVIAPLLWFFPQIMGPSQEQSYSSTSVSATRLSSRPAATQVTTRPIEELKVGDRVMARNPEVSAAQRANWDEPNWGDWLHLSLIMPNEDGSALKIELLRPESWVLDHVDYVIDLPPDQVTLAAATERPSSHKLESKNTNHDQLTSLQSIVGESASTNPKDYHSQRLRRESESRRNLVPLSPLRPFYRDVAMSAEVVSASGVQFIGLTLDMNLPEMGASGTAVVIDVMPCPNVATGEGNPVTATFAHPPSHRVLNVTFEGESNPIGVTDNHLFWSADRQQFLPISMMEIGEHVQTFHGDTKRIEAKLSRAAPQVVYNLEVYGEHVYFVGSLACLVHNSYLNKLIKADSDVLDEGTILQAVMAVDHTDNALKRMFTHSGWETLRRKTGEVFQRLQKGLDGDHIVPKDPIDKALRGLPNGGLKPGDAAYDAVIAFQDSSVNLRYMDSFTNSRKKDHSVVGWIRAALTKGNDKTLANLQTVSESYLRDLARMQHRNTVQIRAILRQHGIKTNSSFLGEFTSQKKLLDGALSELRNAGN